MRKYYLAAALAMAMGIAVQASQAQVDIGTKHPVNGIVTQVATSSPPIDVASNGSAFFDPFGAGFDTQNGVRFPTDSWELVAGPGWQKIAPGVWVLPAAVVPAVGEWVFPNGTWNSSTPTPQIIREPNGVDVSDVIDVFNSRDSAHLRFTPQVANVPEPSSIALLAGGLVPLAVMVRRRRK